MFFAFWSWVGFESSAMYGEVKNPKKIIPVAVVSSVIGIGVFTSSSRGWRSSAPVRRTPLPWHRIRRRRATSSSARWIAHLGTWAVDMFKILLMTGSFACGMALYNCAARYIYAIGRRT